MTDPQPEKHALSSLDHLNLQRPPQQSPDLMIQHRRGLAFCQVIARNGYAQDTAAELGIPADTRLATTSTEFTALPLAPGQWMLSAEWGRDGDFTARIARCVHGVAHASEQSHGRAVFRVAGATAMELLSHECRLDLAAASAGFVGRTTMADIGVLIHKIDDTPAFDLAIYTGYAEHFWDWLTTASQPFNPTLAEEIID